MYENIEVTKNFIENQQFPLCHLFIMKKKTAT